MRNLLFLLLSLCFILASCNKMTPEKFNETIVDANKTISAVSNSYISTLATAVTTGSYENIASVTDEALGEIDKELKIVKDMETPKGGERYKEAALKTYESLRVLIETGSKFSTLTKESSSEELDEMSDQYKVRMNEYNACFEALVQAQVDYANATGHKIQQ